MSAILKDMGIVDYEPRVINQMLEFTYRYVTNILEDARLFSNHAKKRAVDVDDVRLAIQMQAEKTFTSPPPRDLLMEIARQKNSTPLPLIKANAGPRLPPDRYSLTACNYRLKSAKKPRIQVGLPPQLGLTMQTNSAAGLSKVTPALSLNSKTGATLAVVSKSASAPTVTIVSRPATTNKTHPTPIIKLSQRPPLNVSTTVSSAAPTPIVQVTAAPQPAPPAPTTAATVPATEAVTTAPVITTATTEPATQPSVPLPIINIKSETPSEINDKKRKREEDDDYDATE